MPPDDETKLAPGVDRYPHAFSSLTVGPVEVSNRIYMAPHGIPLEASLPGIEYKVPSAETAYYYAERVAGGVALVFHSQPVGPIASYAQRATNPWVMESVPSYSRVADAVHAEGGKIMCQLWYSGGRRYWDALGPLSPTLGASVVQNLLSPFVRRQIGPDEIHRYVETYRQAARNLREAGYDGIEVHASHGVLQEHFLTPYFNKRSDEYGGSVDNRMRLLLETLEVVREEAGPDLAVGIRITADQLLPGGFDEEGAKEILGRLARTDLLDFVDVDIAVEPEQPELMITSYFMPRLHNAARVANVGPAAKPLVILATPGRVTGLEYVEPLLADGVCDMVGAVRGLIAEPEFVNNARYGRESHSRICISANHCFEHQNGFGCAINPATAREERWGSKTWRPAPTPMAVTVVGGGPAGLEAARVAARRGHAVTLLERRPAVGGGLALWASIPGREHLATAVRWWESELADLGVTVHTAVDADAARALRGDPDVVIVATGSQYRRTGARGSAPAPVPGWDRPFVHGPEAIIDGTARLSGRVVVLDEEGLHAGAGAAEILAAGGAEVELVTRLLAPTRVIDSQAGSVVSRLRAAGVTIRTLTDVKEIGDDTVTLVDLATKTEQVLPVSGVVIATMREPVDEIYAQLAGRASRIYLIGDALAPRSLREATYEGHRFARVIGEADMPEDTTAELFLPMDPLRPAAQV